jgi:diguanylate cyclase (GGDEF)-like protein
VQGAQRTRALFSRCVEKPGERIRAAVSRARLGLGHIGIGVRLGAAFVVVTLLAITANLTAERVVLVTRTEVVERPAASARSSGDVSISAHPADSVASSPLLPGPLMAALGRFDRALLRRTELPVQSDTEQMRGATEGLQTELQNLALASKRAPDSAGPVAALTGRIAMYRQHAEQLVSKADRRRDLFSTYWTQLEAMDARVKHSLDLNWKIFGRIIARESLVSLSRDIDDIRRASAHLSPAGDFDTATIAALTESYGRFAQALEQKGRAFTRSQGVDWLEALRTECGELIATRNALVLVDQEAHHQSRELERDSIEIVAAFRAVLTPLARVAPAQTVLPAKSAVANATGVHAPTRSVTMSEQVTHPNTKIILLLVSGTTLALLLFICVHTVRSIVAPIGRMIRITGQLAHGETSDPLPRGGIRQLDLLAAAFNDMAGRLDAARTQMRDYQVRLEERVDERTRQLQHLAEHDPLTALPNRRQFMSYLGATLRRAERNGVQVGVLFLDVDNFKNINDSMGHAFGDRLLVAIATRLREATEHRGFAARLGGDEFTVIYDEVQGPEDLNRVGGALVHAFHQPFLIENRDILVGVSVGASLYPDDERDGEALLCAADAALFQAKSSGRSQLSLFNPAMVEAASLKFRVEQGLRRAVDRGEFELVYQPEVCFESMSAQSVEALLRWRLPDGRNVSPGEFLDVAEQSGLITQISDWVLTSALERAALWHRGPWPNVRVAINVSARQLLDATFVDRVAQLLHRYNLPPACIEIELTETVLQTGPVTIESLRRLRELGTPIALDDFGAGYSSLASLERLPLTRVKLDRSLIASIHTSPRSLAIARAIVGLCGSLGLAVTAEGIEEPEQLAALMEFHALTLQGYLISKPVSADSLPAVIAGVPQHLETLLLTLPHAPQGASPPASPARPHRGRTRRRAD